MQALRLVSLLLALSGCLASAPPSLFEYFVAPATDTNMRNSEADMLQLRDGRLMLAWIEFYTEKGSDWGPARISAMYSRDRGRTWRGKFTLQENIATMNVMEPDLLRLKSGKILFLFCRKNSEADCLPMVRLSTDEARTFSHPQPLPIEPSPSYTGFNHDRAIQLSSGRILMPLFYTTDYRVDRHIRSRVYYSDDEGATWRPSRTILDIPASRAGAQEPGVIELKDGRILLWLRTDQGKIYRSYSNDRGETFSEPQPMALNSVLSPQSIKRIPSTGDLLLVWNYSTRARFPLTAAISKDEGETWTHFRNLDQDPAHTYAYTSIEFVKDRALFTYYAGPPPAEKSGPRWNLKLKSAPVRWFYNPNVIVALGDSVTWGVRRDGSVRAPQTFVSLLERDLQKTAPGLHVVNAGIGGNTSRQMLERLDTDVLAYRPRLAIVMAGLNDAAYVDPGPTARTQPRIPLDEYSRNLREITRRLREAGAQVILATPNPITPRFPYSSFGWYKGRDINQALNDYVQAVRALAPEAGAELVDVYAAYRAWKNYEATLPDGVHPDAAGHRFLADLFLQPCRKHARRWK